MVYEYLRRVRTMAHSFMLELVDPAIDTSRVFNIKWYAVKRMEKIGYSKEELDDAMCANTRARIEMAMPRMLKSITQRGHRPWSSLKPTCFHN